MGMKNILIVSKDETFGENVKKEFGSDNTAITLVKEAQLAAQMTSAKNYCAMIVDIDLEAILSYDLLYRIGVLPISVPVVAVTERLTADNMILAYDFGVLDIINKNFNPGELSAVFRKAKSLQA